MSTMPLEADERRKVRAAGLYLLALAALLASALAAFTHCHPVIGDLAAAEVLGGGLYFEAGRRLTRTARRRSKPAPPYQYWLMLRRYDLITLTTTAASATLMALMAFGSAWVVLGLLAGVALVATLAASAAALVSRLRTHKLLAGMPSQ